MSDRDNARDIVFDMEDDLIKIDAAIKAFMRVVGTYGELNKEIGGGPGPCPTTSVMCSRASWRTITARSARNGIDSLSSRARRNRATSSGSRRSPSSRREMRSMMKLSADGVELDARQRFVFSKALLIAARVLRSDPDGAHSDTMDMETMLAAWFTPREGDDEVAPPNPEA
jgi:hypothetical protein